MGHQCQAMIQISHTEEHLRAHNQKAEHLGSIARTLGCISLLLPRLPKLPSKCYSHGPGNLGNKDTFKQDNDSTVGGDGGGRVGEVRAGTTSPMPDHKGFKLQ